MEHMTLHESSHPYRDLQQKAQANTRMRVMRLAAIVGGSVLGIGLIVYSASANSIQLPCPVPATETTNTTNQTPLNCTTNNGNHYVWMPASGGWVQSDEYGNPLPGARGIGADSGSDGVGSGSDGSGHGGGDAG